MLICSPVGTCGKGLNVDLVPLSDWGLAIILQRYTELKLKSQIPTSDRADVPRTASCQWAPGWVSHSPITSSGLTTWWQLNSFITEASFRNSILSRMLADSLTVLMATLVSGSSFTTPLAIPSYTIPKEPCPSSLHMVIFSRGTSHSSGTYTEERENRLWCSSAAHAGITPCSTTATARAVPGFKPHNECWDLAPCMQTVQGLLHTEAGEWWHTNISEKKVCVPGLEAVWQYWHIGIEIRNLKAQNQDGKKLKSML